MYAVVWKVHGYCFKNSVFYKEKKVPRPLKASIEGLKSIFRANKILSTSVEASQGSGTFSLLLNTEFLGQYPCTFQTTACMHLTLWAGSWEIFVATFEEKILSDLRIARISHTVQRLIFSGRLIRVCCVCMRTPTPSPPRSGHPLYKPPIW